MFKSTQHFFTVTALNRLDIYAGAQLKVIAFDVEALSMLTNTVSQCQQEPYHLKMPSKKQIPKYKEGYSIYFQIFKQSHLQRSMDHPPMMPVGVQYHSKQVTCISYLMADMENQNKLFTDGMENKRNVNAIELKKGNHLGYEIYSN